MPPEAMRTGRPRCGVGFPVDQVIMVAMAQYTYLVLSLPRGTTRDTARQILTEHAERGGWEIDRLRLYPDGRRRIQLRRKVIRVVRTF
ncbi:hypothetical protein GCM10022254_00050 [Actinomadura meridiana]|uniref:Transposase n=2 Tax=Actinomadura meridiana TaxID=559626 RepID=A0ABP8BRM1_9ACTN